jgi:Fe-S cluster assembly ATP-binding protein
VSTLEIRNLQVTVKIDNGTKEILRGVDLTVRSGETHAIMGPNGSGKSTLAYSIAGHPKYTITGGTVTLDGEDVLAMKVDERARAGLFLAMQYPVEVPGVTVSNFLRTAKTAIDGEAPKLRTWVKDVKGAMATLRIVSEGVNRAKATSPATPGIVLITHYTRILRYIKPDFVHVFVDGKIVEEGGPELADRLEAEGYDRFVTAKA